ncbi:uncharacterized protein A1O5_03736 [Cladophialophora psammophila CBS 110553]|uniref:AB hydrolase-1 domain-containing protein n=1 Tax=Cladophialophora psammophila CBS 110553 TaxID=1182543 RepID=W9X5J0_9EURO|nr:uncharacterized protein A1O5_03736 [Cladophialophora psammophila CBS 110553]EXJ72590.1 hypothetical protein A1O5_03736 [Cladophialophora psammophila CBS 110553]
MAELENLDYAKAPVQILRVNNSTFAYRLFGTRKQEDDVPLFLPTHFRSRLDFWDPALIDALASQRRLLLLDNHGSADPQTLQGSKRTARADPRRKHAPSPTPSTPPSFTFWAREIIALINALGFKRIDVLGFSMGGFIGQMLALDAPPGMVRKLILAGTAPSQGPGVESGDMHYFQNLTNATTDGEIKAGFLAGFFGLSEERQKTGEKWWNRITSRSSMWPFMSTSNIDGQITAMTRWYGLNHRAEGSYDRLGRCPVLILCGQRDKLVPEQNSILLWQKISQTNPNVHIHMYPESGHGFMFEYHGHCASLVNEFLDEEVRAQCTCEYCEY